MEATPQRPALTVGVPLYNMEGLIARCLDSLTHEDGPVLRADLEILVVDDGSTDGSASVARAYEGRHPGLRVLSKTNGGHGSAVEYARRAARGEYFCNVDSDDEVVPDTLRKIVAFLRWITDRGVGIDVLVVERIFLDERTGSRIERPYRHALPTNRTFGWGGIGKLAYHEAFSMHTLIYRREHLVASRLHMPNHTYYVDCLYAFTPLIHATRFYHLPLPFYLYHIGRPGQSVETPFVMKHIEDRMRVVRTMVAEMDRCPAGAGRVQRRYLIRYLSGFLVVTLGMLTVSERDDRDRKKTDLLAWMRRSHRRTYRKIARRPLVALARMQGGPGLFVTRIGRRVADARKMLI